MSKQETRKGKLRKVENIEGETNYNKKILQILAEAKYELEDGYTPEESIVEYTYDRLGGNGYVMLNDVLYEVLEDVELDDGYFCEMVENRDGTIDYLVSWCNVGGCLDEVLEDGIKNMKRVDYRNPLSDEEIFAVKCAREMVGDLSEADKTAIINYTLSLIDDII